MVTGLGFMIFGFRLRNYNRKGKYKFVVQGFGLVVHVLGLLAKG
jgi:hypothetical protein